LCSRIVLVAEVDERRSVQEQVPSGSQACNESLGSGYSALCSNGERTLEAGLTAEMSCFQWQVASDFVPSLLFAKRKLSVTGSGPGVSRNGGGSTCRGKALWSHELIAFDEAVRDKDLAVNVGVSESWLAFFCDRECQRLCCELGVRKTTPSSGDRARRSYDRSSPGPREIFIRVSPRVSILLVSADESSATLKLERRRQAKLHSGVNKALRSRSYSTSRERLKGLDRACRESDSPEGARFESRLQKLVRHIFLVDSHGVTRGLGTE